MVELTEQDDITHTPQGTLFNVLLYLAGIWSAIGRNAHLVVLYTVGMIVLALAVGLVDVALGEFILVYLVAVPVGLGACVLAAITAVLAIAGTIYE